jgi:hypothetical protein
VETRATGEIESTAGRQAGAGLDQKRIRIDGLRFTTEELRVPAVTIAGSIDSHRAFLSYVTPAGY